MEMKLKYDIEDRIMYPYVLRQWHPALKVTRYHDLTRRDLEDIGLKVDCVEVGTRIIINVTLRA
jgi:hypothetical protein